MFRSFLSLSFSLSSFSICESVAYFFLLVDRTQGCNYPHPSRRRIDLSSSTFCTFVTPNCTLQHLITLWIILSLDNYPVIYIWNNMDFERAGYNNYSIDWNSTFQDFSRIFFAIGLWFENGYSNNFQRSVQSSKWRKCSFQVIIYYRKWILFENILFLIIDKLVENRKPLKFWKEKKTSLCKRFVEFKKERNIFFCI